MRKSNVKIKGKLRTYVYLPLLLTMLLECFVLDLYCSIL